MTTLTGYRGAPPVRSVDWGPGAGVARAAGLAYGLLYLPVVLAFLIAGAPVASYWTAWLGSWWILWVSMTGRIKPLPGGMPLGAQLMRPIAFTQIVFAAYTALTSVFLMLDILGVTSLGGGMLAYDVEAIAAAQRYYLVAHAAFTTGVLWAMDYRTSGMWRLNTTMPPALLMAWVAVGAFVAAQLASLTPGLGQVVERFQTVSLVASVLLLVLALLARQWVMSLIGLTLFVSNAVQSLLSGWKEEVIVLVLLLAAFAYPTYKKTVLLVTPVLMVGLLLAIPTYNETFRSLNWQGDMNAEEAAEVAYATVQESTVDQLASNAWIFLTDRSSEIGLFVDYIASTPERLPFEGTRLAEQAVLMAVPRALWPEKPNVEHLVMERAYANGVIDYRSNVSAKPQYVVDGYLSGGGFGVWLACLLYGLVASWASRLCERWFGGYLVGSALLYTAFFKVLWRGNSFEFAFSAVLWAFAVLTALFWACRAMGWIVPASDTGRGGGAVYR